MRYVNSIVKSEYCKPISEYASFLQNIAVLLMNAAPDIKRDQENIGG